MRNRRIARLSAWTAIGGMGAAALIVAAGCSPPRGAAPTPGSPGEIAAGAVPRTREDDMSVEKAMFGAGCFWGVEARFRQVPGVVETAVGFAGGTTENPTYKDVCTDRTGHAEVVYVEFDPSRVTYEQLLDVFWNGHDPTTRNRQGPDVGSQYRSAIFYFNEAQAEAARRSKAALDAAGKFRRPIVTEISPAPAFYRAEEYHQRYLEKKGLTSCGVGSHP